MFHRHPGHPATLLPGAGWLIQIPCIGHKYWRRERALPGGSKAFQNR